MATVVNAILPMLLLLALGFGLKRSGFVKADAWEGIGQMLYYVFFPALLITRISSADINFESSAACAIIPLSCFISPAVFSAMRAWRLRAFLRAFLLLSPIP